MSSKAAAGTRTASIARGGNRHQVEADQIWRAKAVCRVLSNMPKCRRLGREPYQSMVLSCEPPEDIEGFASGFAANDSRNVIAGLVRGGWPPVEETGVRLSWLPLVVSFCAAVS
ncbi:MAG: hypothetical protein ACREDR_22490 [Blastocatellia bacterium]